MDVKCCNCGEPWDQYHLRHDLADEDPEDLHVEGWRFGSNRLVVLACPACPKDSLGQPIIEDSDRAAIVQELANVLGDDEDGLAATLEDFGM